MGHAIEHCYSKPYLNVLPNEAIWKKHTHTNATDAGQALGGGLPWWRGVTATIPVGDSPLDAQLHSEAAHCRQGAADDSFPWGDGETKTWLPSHEKDAWWEVFSNLFWTKINSQWMQRNGFNFWEANKLNVWKLFTGMATIDIIVMIGYYFCSTSFQLK